VDHTTCIVIRVGKTNFRQLQSDLSNLVIRIRTPTEDTPRTQQGTFSGSDLIEWIRSVPEYAQQADVLPQTLLNFDLITPISQDSYIYQTFSSDFLYQFKVYLPIFTLSDWKVILQGATRRSFNKGDIIIEEGSKSQKIYHITFGTCRIEKKAPYSKKREAYAKKLQSVEVKPKKGLPQILGRIGPPQTLGEISLLLGGSATASVIADSEEVEVLDVEKGFIDVMFVRYPDMAGKFYHYLASVLARRLIFHESSD